MINIEELRIGNWVSYLGTNTQINSISIGESCSYVSTFKSGIVSQEQIKPIQLTEKILINSGFEKDYYGFLGDIELSYGEYLFSLCVNSTRKSLFLSINSAEYALSNIPVNYLHQLQNIYFDLTGKKLKVEL